MPVPSGSSTLVGTVCVLAQRNRIFERSAARRRLSERQRSRIRSSGHPTFSGVAMNWCRNSWRGFDEGQVEVAGIGAV